MDPDEVNLKLHGLAVNNVLAATARDYKKATLAPAAALHHSPTIRFQALPFAIIYCHPV
jgi:hypothetical protein